MTALRAATARLRSLPPGLGEALWIGLTMRVLLSVFAFYVSAEQPMWAPCHFEEARNGWTVMPPWYRDGTAFRTFGIWERWDACWYVKIAAFGYDPAREADTTAFFPLLPLLMRLAAPLFGGNLVLPGIIIPTVALVLALWGIHRTVARDLGERIAERTVLYVAIFPTALFYFAPYTESLYLAAAVWSFHLAREGRWGWAGVTGLLAGWTRPVGALLTVPLLWLVFVQGRRARTRWPIPLAAALAPAVALAAFSLYSLRVTGETPLDAQRRWWGSPEVHWPWELVQASAAWIVRTGDPLQAFDLLVLVGAMALFAIGIGRLPLEHTLLAAPQLFLAATRILPTPLTSTTRYLGVVFPLFIVLALVAERRRIHWTWTIASVLMLALLAHGYLRGDFVARDAPDPPTGARSAMAPATPGEREYWR